MEQEEIRKLVRSAVQKALGPERAEPGAALARGKVATADTRGPKASGEGTRRNALRGRKLVTEEDLRDAAVGSEIVIPAGALITPLARDLARERHLQLVEEGQSGLGSSSAVPTVVPLSAQKDANPEKVVSLGADHGGVALKEDLGKYLRELGYTVLDCGTHSRESVDYPDYAYAVARLVAEGRAARGIMVDGAGIGSCMAANKVPGVRAAMCYDLSTAVNSREHNDANVLTLGGGLVGVSLARQIVKAWLSTAFGGGRHARRVNKIVAIEMRYLKK